MQKLHATQKNRTDRLGLKSCCVAIQASMRKPRLHRRPGFALPQLILLFSSSSLACAKSMCDNEGSIISNRTLAHHYFFHEIDFLARQSMVLGNYHGDADKATSISSAVDKIQRLRFLEKSLLIELDYIRRLKEMLNNPSDILHKSTANESCSVEATGCGIDEMRFRRDTPREIIANTISGATWPTLAPPSSKNETIYLIDHDYDINRASERGFVGMYHDFDCPDHAAEQNKPMYTPEMWRKLWEVFRDESLFPFPIPNAHECPEEPFYAAYTTDGKGRGVFASRNITKGSLVHPGHPNT